MDDHRYKYVVCPGRITSETDKQWHNVTADQLVLLYGVPRAECVIYDYDRAYKDAVYERQNEWKLSLIKLFPRSDGKYVLPKEASKPAKKVVWPFPVVIGSIP